MDGTESDFARQLVERNRYLAMATTDASDPWIAPLEYILDDDLNLYFFSPEKSIHSQHLEQNASVAIAIWDSVQPEYEPAPTIRISGVQILGIAEKLGTPYPELVEHQIQAWGLPMPPYAAYRISPRRWFLPVIQDGVNQRIEIEMT